MRSIYKTILSKFFTASLIPIILIEISLVTALFWLNDRQTKEHKTSLQNISKEAFSEIASEVSKEIEQQFTHVKNELIQLQDFTQRVYTHPENFQNKALKLYYDQGFFRDGTPGELSSIYTTNVQKLSAKGHKEMQGLSLIAPQINQVIKTNKSLIQTAWVNLDKYYALYAPPIDVPNELSPRLDVTKQRFYSAADPVNNPTKEIKFLNIFIEEWAVEFGQMGAFLAPIYVKDDFKGVIGINMTVNKAAKTFQDIKLPFNAYAVLVDDKSRILVSSNEEKSLKELGKLSFYGRYLKKKEGIDTEMISSIPQTALNRDDKVIFSKEIEGTFLKVLFCASKEDIYGPIETISQEAQTIGFRIIMAIAFFYTLYFLYMFKSVRQLANTIALPLGKIVGYSSKMGEGKEFILEDTSIKELDTLNENLIQTNQRLNFIVNYDETTKLLNHRRLRRDIERLDSHTLVFLALSNFEQVTNLFGPDAGRALLLKMVETVVGSVESGSDIYLESKDVICILLVNKTEQEVVKKLSNLLATLNNSSILYEDIELDLLVTGSATHGKIEDGLHCIAQAHIALSEASKKNRGGFLVYDEIAQITELYSQNALWGKEVRSAFNENRFIAVFQPIYHLKTGKLEKFESLVRMERNGEIISPFKFLDAAENIGKLHDITLVMLEHVFAMAQEHPTIEFSVNTSFADFEERKLLDHVKAKLASYKVDSSKIIFEILETQTFSDGNVVSDMIAELKSMGFKIAIDDFGTGHSNFAHVTMMDVDFIKIDGMFIKHIDTDVLSQQTVTTLTHFAHQIGAKTIAEFVHNEAVYAYVKKLNIDYAQGYYRGAPMQKDEVETLLKSC